MADEAHIIRNLSKRTELHIDSSGRSKILTVTGSHITPTGEPDSVLAKIPLATIFVARNPHEHHVCPSFSPQLLLVLG